MSSAQPGNNRPQGSTDTTTKALWRKPFVWIGGIILAALAGWLTEVFTGALTMLFDPDRYGDPVSVQVDTEAARSDRAISLPPEVLVSKDDEAKVYPAGAQQQADLLAARGGIVIGPRSIMVTITGKRPDAVRITDIRDISDCSSPSRARLVWLNAPFRGHIDPTIRVGVDVGGPTQDVYLLDPGSTEKKPFFPEKTISLKKGESHVLLIDLHPPAGKVCQPQLEMTVQEGDTTHKQNLVPEDQMTQIMDEFPDESQYQQVYLWGNVCQNLVSAPPNWQESRDPCTTRG
ncbi:hypothetical protein [Arthrobacter globiformis]|uniref:hypothetical protein n=1 Tax=Arthrobacter globiformis TaxID=1665 RepID=UPI0027825E84|nr:hypothetical protein [Arthrobacter globiformis]MDQ0864863.1 hypothetical protein [Arthrobacter globiformis]